MIFSPILATLRPKKSRRKVNMVNQHLLKRDIMTRLNSMMLEELLLYSGTPTRGSSTITSAPMESAT